MKLRCAVYARYSTDKQSPVSIDDQIRKCEEHARRNGWSVVREHVYTDKAISGAGSDRPGLNALLRAALSPEREFDVLLVDDSSRLSRNLGDAHRLTEELKFANVRFVAVSQGIDTENEQSDILVAFRGIVDSLYLKDLAKKTHRGMEGLALRGKHTGGRCFGYRNVKHDEGATLEIDPDEARIIRRIFKLYATGRSLKAIASQLNKEGVETARLRAGKRYATWCPTAIREMLRRPLYAGKAVWNRSQFVKKPGTNTRLRRERPREQWITSDHPELRIVSEQLWNAVQNQIKKKGKTFGMGRVNSAISSKYLLSGILKCGECGADMVLVGGRREGRHSRYGCPQYHYRGACANSLTERREAIEKQLIVLNIWQKA